MDDRKRAEEGSVSSYIIRLMHLYSSINFKGFMQLGIHPRQFPVLMAGTRREGIRLRELADLLRVKPPTVTVTVQRLEKAGLVCKKLDENDQRVSRIYLTESGKNLRDEMEILSRKSEAALTEGFSEEELHLLCGFLGRMMENLTRENGQIEKIQCSCSRTRR